MLTPEQIASYRDAVQRLTDPINDYLLADIARRVAEAGQITSTAAYQVWRAQQLGVSQREVRARLQKLLSVSRNELDTLMTQSAEDGYNYNIRNFPTADSVPFENNFLLQNIVRASVELAQDDLTNIVQTLGFVSPNGSVQALEDAYLSCSDFAFTQVATGATDYNTAVRQATSKIAQHGVQVVNYDSGVRTSLEAAVRRNVFGGMGLMQEQISQYNHDQLGADGWEISAHAGSAPDHEPIQGKQYTDDEYQALNESLQRRIGTLNCGHAAFPVLLGISEPQYTGAQLEQMRKDNEQGVTVDGRHYTTYEATQMQRKLERAIRAQKRRVLLAEGNPADTERIATAKTKLTRLNQEYKRFSGAAGLRTQEERLYIPDKRG